MSPFNKRKLKERSTTTTTGTKYTEDDPTNIVSDSTTLKQDKDELSSKSIEEKIIVTGDDILIEYVKRIMDLIRQSQDLSIANQKKLESFLNHKVWYSKENQNRQAESQQLWQRIEAKYIEMQERKKRLFIKKCIRDNIQSDQAEKTFKQQDKQKEDIVMDFSSVELEQMLIQSNKNNPIEVVSLLLCGTNSVLGGITYTSGILTKIEKEAVRISKNNSQILRLLKVTTENVDQQSDQSQSFATPKDHQSKEKNQILARMKTSDEKNSNPFVYNSQKKDPFHYSHSNIKDDISMKSSVIYQSSQASSNHNLLNSNLTKSQKKTSTVERDFSLKQNESKKITLPSINSNHLSQDYSKVSIQLNNATDNSKYRNNKVQQEKYTLKKLRGQSLNAVQTKQSASNIIKNSKLD